MRNKLFRDPVDKGIVRYTLCATIGDTFGDYVSFAPADTAQQDTF